MKNNLVSLILGGSLVLGLTGCGSKNTKFNGEIDGKKIFYKESTLSHNSMQITDSDGTCIFITSYFNDPRIIETNYNDSLIQQVVVESEGSRTIYDAPHLGMNAFKEELTKKGLDKGKALYDHIRTEIRERIVQSNDNVVSKIPEVKK